MCIVKKTRFLFLHRVLVSGDFILNRNVGQGEDQYLLSLCQLDNKNTTILRLLSTKISLNITKLLKISKNN